eukprot:862753-Amorphochlora_amoeboformis.AAC.2
MEGRRSHRGVRSRWGARGRSSRARGPGRIIGPRGNSWSSGRRFVGGNLGVRAKAWALCRRSVSRRLSDRASGRGLGCGIVGGSRGVRTMGRSFRDWI